MIVEPNEIKWVLVDEGQKVGLTSGCFDLLHFYHLHYFQRCSAHCDILVVGVDSDDLVKTNKGAFPAVPEYHRAAMVAALRCVDVVYIQRSLNDLVKAGESADFLFKNEPKIYGTDIVGAETAELVLIEDVVEVQSTTALKNKIREEPLKSSPKPPPRPKGP
jgi:D-beta-D-heptose 7-phosphate kinase/D-beta-D-heptose 1-phosphate adenosyltransferase